MKRVLIALLICQLLMLGCNENLPEYRIEEGNLTDGNYTYEPFLDDYGWQFQTETRKPIGLDDDGNIVFEVQGYGKHLERPIGKREGGNLIDGFQNDPRKIFIQERAGFGASMNYRIQKRVDIVIPTIADADISSQDWVVISVQGRSMAVMDQNIVDAIAEQYLQVRSIGAELGMPGNQIGSISYFFHDFQVSYYYIPLFTGGDQNGFYFINPSQQIVKVEAGSVVMNLLNEILE